MAKAEANQRRTSNAGVINSTTETGYAVFRSGIRVSELVHESEEHAHPEAQHWNKILKRWPDGTVISVEPVRIKH
jgi:hypothetical protein